MAANLSSRGWLDELHYESQLFPPNLRWLAVLSLKEIVGRVTPECLVQTIYRLKLCDVKSALLSLQSLIPGVDSILDFLLSELFEYGSVKQAFIQTASLKEILGDVTSECLVQFIYRQKLCDVESTLLSFQSLSPGLDSFTVNVQLSELFEDGSVKQAFIQMVSLKEILGRFIPDGDSFTVDLLLSKLHKDSPIQGVFQEVASLRVILGDVTPECLAEFIYTHKLCDVEVSLRFFRSRYPNLFFGCQPNLVSLLLTEIKLVQGAFQRLTLENALGCKINAQSLREYIHAKKLSSVKGTLQSFQFLLPELEIYSGQNPLITYLEYCVRRVIEQIILEKFLVQYFYCILIVGFVLEYLMGYVQRGGWATYADTSWEFRATYVSLELRLAAYFWIKFRAATQPSSSGHGHGASSVVPTGTGDLPTTRRKREAGEPCISDKRYPKYMKYEPRVYVNGKRVSLGEYHTPQEAASVYWVAAYYYRCVSADKLPLDTKSLPEIPPLLSDEERASWIKIKAKTWAASTSPVPEGPPPALSTGEDYGVCVSLTSPTGTTEPASAQYWDDLFQEPPCQATREVHTVTSEPPSSYVPPGHCQQVVVEASPCQATQIDSTTIERMLKDFDNEVGDNTNHPVMSAAEHASTGLLKEPALWSGYGVRASFTPARGTGEPPSSSVPPAVYQPNVDFPVWGVMPSHTN